MTVMSCSSLELTKASITLRQDTPDLGNVTEVKEGGPRNKPV